MIPSIDQVTENLTQAAILSTDRAHNDDDFKHLLDIFEASIFPTIPLILRNELNGIPDFVLSAEEGDRLQRLTTGPVRVTVIKAPFVLPDAIAVLPPVPQACTWEIGETDREPPVELRPLEELAQSVRMCAAAAYLELAATAGVDSDDMGFMAYPICHTNAVTIRVAQSEEAENRFEFSPQISMHDLRALTREMLEALGVPAEDAAARYPV